MSENITLEKINEVLKGLNLEAEKTFIQLGFTVFRINATDDDVEALVNNALKNINLSVITTNTTEGKTFFYCKNPSEKKEIPKKLVEEQEKASETPKEEAIEEKAPTKAMPSTEDSLAEKEKVLDEAVEGMQNALSRASSLESDVNNLKKQMAEMEENCNVAVSKREEQLNKLGEEITKLKEVCNEKESNIVSLNQSIEKKEKVITDLKEQVQNREKTIANLDKKITDLDKETTKKILNDKQILDSKDAEITNLKNALAEEKKTREAMKKEMEEKTIVLLKKHDAEATKKLEEMTGKIRHSQKIIDEMTAEIAEKDKKIQAIAKKIEALKNPPKEETPEEPKEEPPQEENTQTQE